MDFLKICGFYCAHVIDYVTGNVSLGDVLTILPFGNVIDMVKLRGLHVRQAFENSVAKYDPVDKPGAFLQASGE